MKKIFITITAILIFSSANSFAKTQGSYFTIEGIRSHLRFNTKYSNDTETSGKYIKPSNVGTDNYGIGLSYKYAFNYNGLFFAPGFFYERHFASADGVRPNNTTASENWERLEVNNRYGIKSDIGFDAGIVAPYLTGGYSDISYFTRNYNDQSQVSFASTHNSDKAFFYGAGLKIEVPRSYGLAVNLEYNTTNFSAKTATNPNTNTTSYNALYKTRFDLFKLGLSVNF